MKGWLGRFGIPVAILLLAFGLRCVTLETRPVWYDDAFSVFLSERGIPAIVAGTAADTDPPLYYVLLSGWMNGVGESPAAMRMLGVALSVLSVAFAFAIGKRAFGASAGNWAALLVALMPFQIYHAQELRMYALLTLGACIYFYGVVDLSLNRGTRMPRRALATIAAGTAVALWAQNLAFATFAAGYAYLILRSLRDTRVWRKEVQLLGAQGVGAVLFLPWLFYLPSQLSKVQTAFYTQRPGVLDVLQLWLVLNAYLPLPPMVTAAALFITLVVLAFAVWFLIRLARRRTLPALGVVVAFAVVPPLTLFVVSYVMRPVFVPRGLVVVGIAYAVLLALLASRAPRGLQIGLGIGAIGIAALLLPFYYSAYGEWRRAPYAEANAFLQQQWQPGDVVLHDNKLSYFPMRFYDRTMPAEFLADPARSDNDTLALASQQAMELYPTSFEQAVEGHPRIWFVIYQTAIDEAEEQEKEHANLAQMDARFARGPEQRYGDLDVILYTRR